MNKFTPKQLAYLKYLGFIVYNPDKDPMFPCNPFNIKRLGLVIHAIKTMDALGIPEDNRKPNLIQITKLNRLGLDVNENCTKQKASAVLTVFGYPYGEVAPMIRHFLEKRNIPVPSDPDEAFYLVCSIMLK